MTNASSNIFLFARGYRTMTSGWQGAQYFRRYGQELVSKPAISFKKNWGAIVESVSCILCAGPETKRTLKKKKKKNGSSTLGEPNRKCIPFFVSKSSTTASKGCGLRSPVIRKSAISIEARVILWHAIELQWVTRFRSALCQGETGTLSRTLLLTVAEI